MDTHYADTTVVYYRLHGHTLQENAVKEAVSSGTLVVSNFVRGEYIRGYVIGLIELYFAIKDEQSVQDGIYYFNSRLGNRHPRKVGNALLSAVHWLGTFEDSTDFEKTLRRLGEHIRGTLVVFDMTFIRRVRDPLNCEIGVMTFPSETYQEDHILDFYEEYRNVYDHPGCDQCEFRQTQLSQLEADSIDMYSECQRKTYAEHEGFVKQAEWIDKAVRSKKTKPTCWYCDRLGDSIIALSAPEGLTILTGDSQSFPPLGEILAKPVKLIPAIDELRAANERAE